MKSIHLRDILWVPLLFNPRWKIIRKEYEKVRYDMNDLLEQCRINGYFDMSEIKYALTGGKWYR